MVAYGYDQQGANVDRAGPSVQACSKLPYRLLKNARILPDRIDILPLLPKKAVVVEVGVAVGDFSDNILRVCDPSLFIAIDIFNLHEIPTLWGRPTREWFQNLEHAAFYRDRFAMPIRTGRMRVLEGDSVAMLATLDDKSVDVFYVDANHTYDSVSRELSVIRHKIKDDGLIIMNDYVMNEVGFSNAPYGVIQATNEFMITDDYEMIYFALQNYMYCDVVIRKVLPNSDTPCDSSEPIDFSVFIAMEREKIESGNQQNFSASPSILSTQNISQMRQEISQLRAALQAMRSSTSWRLSAPLRALSRSLASFVRPLSPK
jgi:hypothetical protein